MAKILLDYFFKITSITPTPAASTAFLKQVLVIVKPKVGATENVITPCVSTSEIDAFSVLAVEADELFDAGMSKVYVLAVDDLTGVGAIIAAAGENFFTVLISYEFSDAEIDAGVFGSFDGVIAAASSDTAKNTTRGALENWSAWHTTAGNRGKNMFWAFGKLLSASAWFNQQYIPMPCNDLVQAVGTATTFFDDKISFALSDDEYGNRLGLFAVGGKAIVAPYIKKNLMIDLQSAALSYVSGNQPAYNLKNAALLESALQKVIQEKYIEQDLIDAGTAEVSLVDDNFVANAGFDISEPKALWRIVGTIKQTL